jgi:hypothetical protein
MQDSRLEGAAGFTNSNRGLFDVRAGFTQEARKTTA